MGTPAISRPLKVGNVSTYVDEVNYLAPSDAPILAPEVDADLDTLYNAWNNPASAFPPTGTAGGDLAGSSYPAPVIKAGAITDAKVSNVAWGKITGAPTSFPPSGAAGGDLVGSSYPAPVIAPGAITNAKVNDVGWSKITGAPTSFPPSGSASGDLSASYPGPSVAKLAGVPLGATTATAGSLLVGSGTQWVSQAITGDLTLSAGGVSTVAAAAKSKWTTGATSITPSDATKIIAAGTSTPGGVGIIMGATTIKMRLRDVSTAGVQLCSNTDAAATVDDASRASWYLQLNPLNDVVDIYRAPAGSTTFYNIARFDSGGSFTISGAYGNKSSGTLWTNPSDRRLKEEITDYTVGLAAILALAPRTFVYNGKGGSEAGRRGYSFIADEVAPVMPEMVGTLTRKLNPDDEHETQIQTLDASNLILALVNAVKELAARVTALEARP